MKIEIDGDSKFALVWESFDGDDCFDIHYAEVYDNGELKRYDFGGCAVKMCLKVVSFFENEASTEVGLGFRNPDIIYYDLKRCNGAFEFVVSYEDRGEVFRYSIVGNCIEIDKSFINE